MRNLLLSFIFIGSGLSTAQAVAENCETQLTDPSTFSALQVFQGESCEDTYNQCLDYAEGNNVCGICENSIQDSGAVGACEQTAATDDNYLRMLIRPPHGGGGHHGGGHGGGHHGGGNHGGNGNHHGGGHWGHNDGHHGGGHHGGGHHGHGNYNYNKWGYNGYFYKGHHGHGGYYYKGHHYNYGNDGYYYFGTYADCPVSLYQDGYYVTTYHGLSCRQTWRACSYNAGPYGYCVGG